MKKLYLVLAVLGALSLEVAAQNIKGSLRGTLQDSVSATPLADATVSIMRLPDSTLISFTVTNSKGFFEIKNIDAGDYVVAASFQGLQTFKKKFSINAAATSVDLDVVRLSRFYKTMDEVFIVDDAPVKVKGDTIAYNADAFKTKPNATAEELLKKLPGVQVDRDGTIRAQGEQVQKVYVDGKEFFGTDPKLATRNLTADMIEQVEVFDDMSEQAKFNKIDDGSRSKAMNLKLKKDKKKGVFGKVYGGYGTDNRYDAGLNANFFKGAMQTSVIAKANNTNNIGFTVNDMLGMFSNGSGGFSGGGMGMMGGGGMNIVRTGGMGGSFGGLNLGSTGSGKTASSQIGFNYKDSWNPKVDISGSYFFNHTETRNEQTSLRQTFGNDTSFINDQFRSSMSRNNNHRVNMNLTWRIDSMNSVIYYPSLSIQNSGSNTADTTSYYAKYVNGKKELNQSRQFLDNTGEGYNWTNNLIWRKRFARPGRTLSVTLANTIGNNDRESYNVFNAKFNPRNTYTVTDAGSRSYNASFSYTEPISRNKIVEVNYGYSRNRNESDRDAFAWNAGDNAYNIIDQLQTNHFVNLNENHRAGANFRVVQKKYNYQLGFSALRTKLVSDDLGKGKLLTQSFTNFFPTASFNYQFQRSRSLRVNYRGSTRQPSVTQLQEVLDISNSPYLNKGNPELGQEFSNNFSVNYNFFDIIRFRNLFANISFSNTFNRISNSITINSDGTQLTMPVNLDGYYMLNANVNFGLPIKKLKGGNFNTTTRVMLNRDPSLYNNEMNYTRNLNLGEDLRLNYNYKEKLDLGITASINYNSIQYSNPSRNTQDQSYFTHSYAADVTYYLPKNFIVSSEFDYTFNTGRSAGYNQNFALWNGSIAKQVFKSKRGEIKASVFDLLNQNISVSRNTGANYFEDVRNLTLQRYFMLTFTFNINRMGGRMMPAMMERATRGIRITQ